MIRILVLLLYIDLFACTVYVVFINNHVWTLEEEMRFWLLKILYLAWYGNLLKNTESLFLLIRWEWVRYHPAEMPKLISCCFSNSILICPTVPNNSCPNTTLKPQESQCRTDTKTSPQLTPNCAHRPNNWLTSRLVYWLCSEWLCSKPADWLTDIRRNLPCSLHADNVVNL